MRILLAQNSLYYPSHGGGDKSNRILMEALAARGHSCRVVARLGSAEPGDHDRFLQQLNARQVAADSPAQGVVVFDLGGVQVHVLTEHPNLRRYFSGQIDDFHPDVILTSTDDPAQLLLEAALKSPKSRVVFLARTTLAVPFGPDCAFPSSAKAVVLHRVDAAVGVSEYVTRYLRQWGGMDAVHVPISLMEPGPFPLLGRFENEFVTLVNPCAVKGISIFLGLAASMPDVAFAAVPTWGTNTEDLQALRRQPNVHLLDAVDNIDKLFARTRVLLVPSLWAEARSRIIPEAMLRGIPVLAADVGGIPEAMLGLDYLLPVRPIQGYLHKVDEQMVPVAQVPDQDIDPWERALRGLLSDRARFDRLSALSRERAREYVAGLSVLPFESLLEEVRRRPRKSAEPEAAEAKQSTLESLSPERRRLLALRLKKRHSSRPASDPWFPSAGLSPATRLRLFCFPYAGAGTSAFHGWAERLPKTIQVCPARLPGRESRLGERPLTAMASLVDSLAAALVPYLDHPFAFFGHSLGAALAFELTRSLRREKRPSPAALLLSGARAPRLRLAHTPSSEPPEEEFLREIQKLEGLPEHVRESEELLRIILPALRADTTLFREHTYLAEPPLDVPIRAYGGNQDPNIRREHLETWAAETTGSFNLRLFDGGHFFLETARDEFLAALAEDLATWCS